MNRDQARTIEPERIVGDTELWNIAEQVCTRKELQTLRDVARGFTYRQLADADHVSHSVIYDRVRSAKRKVVKKLKEAA